MEIEKLWKSGNNYLNEGNFKKAIEFYEKILKIDPKYVKAWNNMGLAYDEINNFQRAIDCYTKAIEIATNDSDLWYNLGLVNEELEKKLTAIQCFLKGIQNNPASLSCLNAFGIALAKLDKEEWQKNKSQIKKTNKNNILIDYIFHLMEFLHENDYKGLVQLAEEHSLFIWLN